MENLAINAFSELATEDWLQISELNNRVQSHTGSWGEIKDGKKDEAGVIEMPYADPAPIIDEFMRLWYEKNLVISFDWSSWQAGQEWFASDDETKYQKLDIATALKLMTAVLRNDRFNDGTLMRAFESGDFPKILQRLLDIHEKSEA